MKCIFAISALILAASAKESRDPLVKDFMELWAKSNNGAQKAEAVDTAKTR